MAALFVQFSQLPLEFLHCPVIVAAQVEVAAVQQFAPEQVTHTPLVFLKLVALVATQALPFQQFAPEQLTHTPAESLKLVVVVAVQALPFQQFAPEQATQTPLEFLKLVALVAAQVLPFQQFAPEQLTQTPLEFLKLVALVATQVLPFQQFAPEQATQSPEVGFLKLVVERLKQLSDAALQQLVAALQPRQTPFVFLNIVLDVATQALVVLSQQFAPEQVTHRPVSGFLNKEAVVAEQEVPFQQFAPAQATQFPEAFLKFSEVFKSQ